MEQIIEEILEIIYNYRLKYKDIDEHFIESVLASIIAYRDLSLYIRNIEFKSFDEQNRAAARYFYNNKKIEIYWLQLRRRLKLQNFPKLNANEMLSYEYLETSKILAHETDHADQNRIIDLNKNDPKTLILASSFNALSREFVAKPSLSPDLLEKLQEFIELSNEYQQICASFAPEERMADIYGYKMALELISKMDSASLSNLESHYTEKLTNTFLRGYDVTNNPTAYYLRHMHETVLLPDILRLSGNISLEERLYLGLEISSSESSLLLK